MVKRGCQSPSVTPLLYEMPGKGEHGKKGPWHRSADQGEQSSLYTSLVRSGSHACDWPTSVRIHPLPPGLGTLSPEPIEGLVGRKIRLHRASGGSWVVPEAMVGEGGGALESDGLGSSLILLLAG